MTSVSVHERVGREANLKDRMSGRWRGRISVGET